MAGADVIGAIGPAAFRPHKVIHAVSLEHTGAFHIALGRDGFEEAAIGMGDEAVHGLIHDGYVAMAPAAVIEIDGAVGVATSGNYRNFHESKRYGRFGHTIDPVTGRPVATDVVSATVIAPDAATADAWATACMASDAATAIDRIRQVDGLECLLVVAAGDSTLQTVATKSFPKAVR